MAFGLCRQGRNASISWSPIASEAGEKVVAMNSPTVAIQPFEDHRTAPIPVPVPDITSGGGESHFSLSTAAPSSRGHGTGLCRLSQKGK